MCCSKWATRAPLGSAAGLPGDIISYHIIVSLVVYLLCDIRRSYVHSIYIYILHCIIVA